MTIRQAVVDRVGTAGADVLSRPLRLTLTSARRRSLAVLGAVWVFGALYESYFLYRGWFPQDEGALAESARRVLAGELPHRDFAELYTGALSYLHALGFLAFGEELTSMRLVLFAFFIAWIPALYAVARYFASPVVAGTCVAASIAWSVPNWSASMPSWYNLFFATFAVAFFLRYCDDRRARWLIAAGLACGVSVTFKSTGIYVVIALLLVLVFDGQVHSKSERAGKRAPNLAFVVACAVATLVFLVMLVHRRLGIAEAVNFILPGSCIAIFLVWSELRRSGLRPRAHFRSLLGPFGSLGLGFAVPIVLFIAPYAISGSLGSLVDGVLVEPSARLRFAAMKPSTIGSLPLTLLVLIWVIGLGHTFSRAKLGGRAVMAGLLAICFVLTGTSLGYRIAWGSVHDASLFLVPVGIVLLGIGIRRGASRSIDHVRTFTLLALFAFASLVQFPFSSWIYFFYVAPIMFVAVLALAAYWREASGSGFSPFVVGALFIFLAAVGVARVNQAGVGGRNSIGGGTQLGLARSGALRVSASNARLYRHVVARIKALGASSYIYAGPDASELYFLADRRNPTRALFEFLEGGPMQDRDLLRQLDRYGVRLVALNRRPVFSPPLDSRLRAALVARYPHHERVGRFELRWRT